MKSPSIRARRRAFTLMETLVVVAIIAILMALLIPAIMSVFDRAKAVKASSAIQDTVNGIRSFETDYSRMPSLGHPRGNDLAIVAEADQIRLYNVLRNREARSGIPADQIENTRGDIYTGTYPVVGVTAPRGGFTNAGALYDPWGRLFVFVLDSNYDNLVDIRALGVSPSPGQDPEITSKVLGLSHGKLEGTDQQKDDVKNF